VSPGESVSRKVRRDQDSWHIPEWVVGRERLRIAHIERRPDTTLFEQLEKSLRVDDRSPRSVDEQCGR